MTSEIPEFFVQAKWGKIACISCGNPKNSPILLIHGYMDTAATFITILKHLPKKYYYVALDLPGHGHSDPFPMGPIITQAHQVYAIHQVIEHLKWDKFMCMTHSVGFILGVLYNNLYPDKITKMVSFDPVPPISTYLAPYYILNMWYEHSYEEFYKNYSRWKMEKERDYTYEQAINLIMKNRKVNEEQAAILLSRTLIPVGDNKYRLSWDPVMKKLTAVPMTEDTFIKIVTVNAPPMLVISASHDSTVEFFKRKGAKIMQKIQETMKNLTRITIDGPHDLHIVKPEEFIDKIIAFFDSPVKTIAKL
ncbi:serine hydrolase-like protein [Melitaea cinxia]|uniref:serine hydrolase-like protein n=1 Tax=Melitaea cinxia TaxID=113334 RepID=UPI001E274818|nr:serine hydrolase-like protein [Melitaea cinxia]